MSIPFVKDVHRQNSLAASGSPSIGKSMTLTVTLGSLTVFTVCLKSLTLHSPEIEEALPQRELHLENGFKLLYPLPPLVGKPSVMR